MPTELEPQQYLELAQAQLTNAELALDNPDDELRKTAYAGIIAALTTTKLVLAHVDFKADLTCKDEWEKIRTRARTLKYKYDAKCTLARKGFDIAEEAVVTDSSPAPTPVRGKPHFVDETERQKILDLWGKNYNRNQIARKVGRSFRTVNTVIDNATKPPTSPAGAAVRN